MQFAWFVGQAITLISCFFFFLTYIGIGKQYKFWHQCALFGVLESFGVLIFQVLSKNKFDIKSLRSDDNLPYFLLGAALLYFRAYVFLTLVPFALFSFFHVLVYTTGVILPFYGLDELPISKVIEGFISSNKTQSIELADILEIYLLGWLFIRLITFRSRSLGIFLVYVVFTKIKYEKSLISRNHFKALEIKIDNAISSLNVPAAKQIWFTVKDIFRKFGAFNIVNDYTKEKST